jgi:hypothetical protein
MMTALLGFCALVVDIGGMSLEKSRLQNAVDSAALAAAQDLPSTLEASNTAEQYLASNGFDEANITISFAKSSRQITVEAVYPGKYALARVLGVDNLDVKASATAQKGGKYLGGVFDYAVFSGSKNDEININSNSYETYIQGSVHSNNGFRYNGNKDKMTITGAIDAVGKITLNGNNYHIGKLIPYSNYIEMPDFSEEIKQLAQSVGTYYNTNHIFNSNIHLNEAIYVDGHVHFNCQKFSGVGTILATEDVHFNNSVVYGTDDDSSSICIYSKNGDIIINNTSAVVNGTFYAPNGSVILNNGAHTINGRIIAKKLIFNGGLEVYSSDSDVVFMESFDEGIKLVK